MASAGSGSSQPSGASGFDPYHELLGIPAIEQPPTHYRLLGLAVLESNPKVIERAADRQMQHLRTMQTGPYAAAIQKLLNEISKAQVVLLDPAAKAKYDTHLQAQLEATQRAATVSHLEPLQPMTELLPTADPLLAGFTAPATTQSPGVVRPAKSQHNLSMVFVAGGIGGLAAIVVLAIVVWQMQSPPAPELATDTTNSQDPTAVPSSTALPPPLPLPPPAPSSSEPPKPPANPGKSAGEQLASENGSTMSPSMEGQPSTTDLPTGPNETPENTSEPAAPSGTGIEEDVPQTPNDPSAAQLSQETRAELDQAKADLRVYPKFEKYYTHLDAHPEQLATNGPKLAQILWDEVTTNQIIADHKPSFLAAMEEVERLALAGGNYELALRTIDARLGQKSSIFQLPEAMATKLNALDVATAMAAAPRATAEVRKEVQESLLAAIEEVIEQRRALSIAPLVKNILEITRTSQDRLETIPRLLAIVDRAISQADLSSAVACLEGADELLKKVIGKERLALTQLRDQTDIRLKNFQAFEVAQADLKQNPTNPSANEKFGLLLLERGKVDESLPFLVQSASPELKQLAMATSQAGDDASSLEMLADRWSGLATAERVGPAMIAEQLLRRALDQEGLKGLARAAVEVKLQRIEKLTEASKASIAAAPTLPLPNNSEQGSPLPGWTSLPKNRWFEALPLIDFCDDVACGYWYNDNTVLWVARQGKPISKIEVPLQLGGCDYDLQLDFEIVDGEDRMVVHFPLGTESTYFVLGDYTDLGKRTFFYRGRPSEELKSDEFIEGNIVKLKQRYRLLLTVRQKEGGAELASFLNDKPVLSTFLPHEHAKNDGPWNARDPQRVVLTSLDAQSVYYSLRVKMLTGNGRYQKPIASDERWPPKIRSLKTLPLTSLPWTSIQANYEPVGNSKDPSKPVVPGVKKPVIDGKECDDFIFAHAKSRVTYDIPPKAKYFTSYCVNVRSVSASFSVRIDGVELFRTEGKAISRCLVEIPPGSKTIELICGDMGDDSFDHTMWAYPAFR
ncbi:hypothetical protein Psta_1909 [Pirellula staleyi DSM 6068]|uniref:Glycosyl hydrolase family 98 putative carbohydrate-binding module domain-containing protein n=1 Tax=Pirellula staleyi (strain ATCC 27377 / DSM 6068 / ICPB 4128) TaxID=530564 RepID=D2QZV0_PIRSD|nr:NPCBM/NEW2 domain-containing protein [Pirellula staleyi]ADB16583.1 hypothetical protein Psta_1909 [Pirellula staleyi DSM 6068]